MVYTWVLKCAANSISYLGSVFIVCLCFSCAENTSSIVESTNLDNVRHIDKFEIGIPDFVQDTSLIFLENREESIFTEISKIIIKGDFIYILDIFGFYDVIVFDRKGKFVRRIGKRGRGPGEYQKLCDFAVDSLGNVYLYDRQQMQLLFFSNDGEFQKVEKIPFRADSFELLDSGYFIFSMDYISENENVVRDKIVITDNKFNIVSKHFHYSADYRDELMTIGMITETESGYLYNKPISDTLVYFNTLGEINEVYAVDFGKSMVPAKFKDNYMRYHERKLEHSWRYIYNPPYKIGHYLIGNMLNGDELSLMILDLQEGVVYYENVEKNNLSFDRINFPVGVCDNSTIISSIDADILNHFRDLDLIDRSIVNYVNDGGIVLRLHRIIGEKNIL